MATISFPTSPADRFAAILGAFRRAVAAEAAKNRVFQALLVLVWSRLGRIASRFAHLAARIPADAPPRPHRTLIRAVPLETVSRKTAPKPWAHLPRSAGWVMRFVPASVFPARSQLQHLFADEAMQALLAASPGLRRTLRPLCRMLGLNPPSSPPLAEAKPQTAAEIPRELPPNDERHTIPERVQRETTRPIAPRLPILPKIPV